MDFYNIQNIDNILSEFIQNKVKEWGKQSFCTKIGCSKELTQLIYNDEYGKINENNIKKVMADNFENILDYYLKCKEFNMFEEDAELNAKYHLRRMKLIDEKFQLLFLKIYQLKISENDKKEKYKSLLDKLEKEAEFYEIDVFGSYQNIIGNLL